MSLRRLRTRLAALERAATAALRRSVVRWPGAAVPADVRPQDLVLVADLHLGHFFTSYCE